MNGTYISCLFSEGQLLPVISAPSDLSFSQSSTDFPSLIDHCLTDSVAAEIDIMTSPANVESTDDNDFHSAMSTPPLHPDSDNDIILPVNECYANGIFPDKIDDLYVSQSSSDDHLVLDSMMGDCGKVVGSSFGDIDMVSKQPDVEVNSLLPDNEGEASKGNNEKESSVDNCNEVVDQAVDGSDNVITEQLDVNVDSLLRLGDREISKNDNETESFECVQTSRFDNVASCDCETAESVKDISDSTGTVEVRNDTVSSLESDLASLQNVDGYIHPNCDATFPVSVQERSAEPGSDNDRELVSTPLVIVQFEEVAIDCELQLPTVSEGSEANRTPKTEDVQPVFPSDMLCDSSKTDAEFVADLSSPVMCGDIKTEGLSSGNKGIVENDVKMDIAWPSLSDTAHSEDSVKDASTDVKPFITTTTGDSSVSTTYLGSADSSGVFGSFPTKVKGTLPMPCIASFSSSNSDDWSFDESWLPDWKLQTNAVVRLKRLVLPVDQYSQLLKSTADSKDKSTSCKSNSQSRLTLASVEPLLSKLTSDESPIKCNSQTTLAQMTYESEIESASPPTKFAESNSSATKVAIKSPPILSERSSFSALMEDISTKQSEKAEIIHMLPVAVTDVPLSSSSSSSYSTSYTKAPSSTVASASSQQKYLGYEDYSNNPRFQPVVRLVRLPLEFFRMLQQKSHPAVSSSISVSDLQKRFVIL